MTDSSFRLSPAHARALIRAVLERLGASPDAVAATVDQLVEASLTGYDAHGIMRIPTYVKCIGQGTIIPGAVPQIVKESPASALLDAHLGLGPLAARLAVDLAGDKARVTGVGCVSITRANDIACLGSYLWQPAAAGLIALLMVNDGGGGPVAVPWGGTQAFLSTNPLAAAVPRAQGPPLVIDMATSISSFGKVRMRADRGQDIPPDWLIEANGQITQAPHTLVGQPRTSALLPLGSPSAGHKGFGLSLLVDILAGALSGAGCSAGEASDLYRNGVFALAVDPQAFVGLGTFEEQVEAFVAGLKQVRPAPGLDRIVLPGERADRLRRERRASGIPIDAPTRRTLANILADLNLADRYGLGKDAH
ncbi:Ldh family oxidoreductase [bacterium]|nr:Ldh family oxidoreductase [bacterium]